MDFKKLKHIHFTGIKGVGMTALAIYVKQMGIKTTGSDVDEIFVTDEVLARNNIAWNLGFGVKNLEPKPDLLVATAAHGGLLNPEVQEAKKMGIKVVSYAEMLAVVSKQRKLVSVSGVGGKTTTSSMIATLLDYARFTPCYVIGVGGINPLGDAGKYNANGKYFVCEADEFAISPGVNNNPKFSLFTPYITVVTNIEHDHPDIYPSIKETLSTFKKFFIKTPKSGLLVACIDNKNVAKLVKDLRVPIQTYGFSKTADWQIRNLRFDNQVTTFSVYSKKDKLNLTEISLSLPGRFNALNALACFIVGNYLGIGIPTLKQGIEMYLGSRRRFERMGDYFGATFYDDYAHHPGELRATLKAAKEWYPERKIIAIFQPHTYSRTKTLFKDFSLSFKDADVIGLMDIYASARESEDPTVSSKLLTTAIKKHHKKVYYLGGHKETLKWLKNTLKTGDIILTLGAGDIFHLYNEMKSSKP